MDNTSNTPAVTPTETAQPVVEAPKKTRGKYAVKDTSAYPVIAFKWSDGTIDSIDAESFDEATQKQAKLHGFSQKFGDSYASAKDLAEAKNLFAKAVETVRTKGWAGRAEAAEAEEPVELLAQAVVLTLQEDGKQPELAKILEQIKTADRKTRNLWRGVPRVSYHLANLRKHTETPTLEAFGY